MASAPPAAPVAGAEASFDLGRIRRSFEKVDGNGDGVLSRRQLARVLDECGTTPGATTAADVQDLLVTSGMVPSAGASTGAPLASDADAELFDFENTVALVKMQAMLTVFAKIDANHDGSIDANELVGALSQLGLDVPPDKVGAMLERVDKSGNQSVEFDEFFRMFKAHAGADLKRLSGIWMSMTTADTGSDFSAVPPPKAVPLWQFVVAGGMGGVVSRTATAPLERIKILAQTSTAKTNMRLLFRDVIRTEGWRGLFAGNGANIARVFPFGGLVCLGYSRCIRYFPTDDEFDIMEPFYRGAAGALAGAFATTATYPLDVVKARLSAVDRGQYGGIVSTFRKIVAEEGARALLKGYVPTVMAIAPFLAVQQSSYDVMKQLSAPYVEPSLGLFVGLGAVAGVVAQTVIHPIDLVRRRMQMARGQLADGAAGGGRVIGAAATLQLAFADGGWRGLFAGWGAATMKVIPAVAIGLTVRDALLGRHKK